MIGMMKIKTVLITLSLVLGSAFIAFAFVIANLLSKDLIQLENATHFPMADEVDFLGKG